MRISSVERDDDREAGEDRAMFRGVPVKAVAVATTRARRRAVMADLMANWAAWGGGGGVLYGGLAVVVHLVKIE